MPSSSMVRMDRPQSPNIPASDQTPPPIVNENAPEPAADLVGREFVRQYYTVLNKANDYLFRFYSNDSVYVRGSEQQPVEAVGQQSIQRLIEQSHFVEPRVKIRSVRSHKTLNDGVVVQVCGELSNEGAPFRRFVQTFVLQPQAPKKYYLHNDVLQYLEDVFTIEDGQAAGDGIVEGAVAEPQPRVVSNGMHHQEPPQGPEPDPPAPFPSSGGAPLPPRVSNVSTGDSSQPETIPAMVDGPEPDPSSWGYANAGPMGSNPALNHEPPPVPSADYLDRPHAPAPTRGPPQEQQRSVSPTIPTSEMDRMDLVDETAPPEPECQTKTWANIAATRSPPGGGHGSMIPHAQVPQGGGYAPRPQMQQSWNQQPPQPHGEMYQQMPQHPGGYDDQRGMGEQRYAQQGGQQMQYGQQGRQGGRGGSAPASSRGPMPPMGQQAQQGRGPMGPMQQGRMQMPQSQGQGQQHQNYPGPGRSENYAGEGGSGGERYGQYQGSREGGGGYRGRQDEEMRNQFSVFIKNLPPETKDDAIRELFRTCELGEPYSIAVRTGKAPEGVQGHCFAFVTMSSVEEAQNIIQTYSASGLNYQGEKLVIQKKKTKEEMGGPMGMRSEYRGSGYGRGRGGPGGQRGGHQGEMMGPKGGSPNPPGSGPQFRGGDGFGGGRGGPRPPRGGGRERGGYRGGLSDGRGRGGGGGGGGGPAPRGGT